MIPDIENKLEKYETLEEIKRAFQKPFDISNNKFSVTVSGGLSVYPQDGETLNTLLKNADLALSLVKDHGKNNICLYANHMKKNAYEKVMLKNYLLKAIEEKELYLKYQAKLNVATNQLVGAEAKIHWFNRTLANIAPEDLLRDEEEMSI